MSGRRVFRRFSHQSTPGLMRISWDVEVDIERTWPDVVVLSEAPCAIGEQLTLALVSSSGESEVRVRVADSRPHFADGVMRHRLRLEVVAADPAAGNVPTEPRT